MNKNIRDYMKNNNNNVNTDIPSDVKSQMDGYARMNESQLLSEMTRLAGQGKNNGTLSAESLQNFYNQVSPMMSVEQRNKLKQLITGLKQ